MNKLCVVVMSLVPALALADTPAPAKAPPAAPAKAPAAAPTAPAKAPAAAPAAPTKAAPPAMPAAPAEVKLTVDAFKGNWKFDVTITATGMPGMDKPIATKMSFNCKPTAGGTAVACDSKAKTPMGPMDALFVVAYDPYSKAVHFMGITNQNEVHDHVCQWSGMDMKCTPLKGGMGPGGDEVVEDLTMTFESAKCDAAGAGTCAASCKGTAQECATKCDIKTVCPPKMVSFKSSSKMTKGGATIVFEGKGKK